MAPDTAADWWQRLRARLTAPRERKLRHQAKQTAVTAEEADRWLSERSAWQQRISDALGITWQELHGGGATIYAELDDCVRRIEELKAERDAGWSAAYKRGRSDEREGRDDPTAT